MRLLRSAALAAALWLGCTGTAQAAVMEVTGSGKWDGATGVSGMTAPANDFSFSFLVDDALVHSPAEVSSFSYLLGGQPLTMTAPVAAFYSAPQGGGFEIRFADTLLSGVGGSLLSPGLQLAPVDGMAMSFSTDTGNGAGSGFVSVRSTASPAVPEPATWMMLLTGFALVGYTLRRRNPVASRRCEMVPSL
jgi:hypothetical protein